MSVPLTGLLRGAVASVKTIGPLAPGAPTWMCAAVGALPSPENSSVRASSVCSPFRVTVARPVAVVETGGTSSEPDSAARNEAGPRWPRISPSGCRSVWTFT